MDLFDLHTVLLQLTIQHRYIYNFASHKNTICPCVDEPNAMQLDIFSIQPKKFAHLAPRAELKKRLITTLGNDFSNVNSLTPPPPSLAVFPALHFTRSHHFLFRRRVQVPCPQGRRGSPYSSFIQ